MNTESQKHLFVSYPEVDTFFTTSNGWAFVREDDAIEAAKQHKLEDKTIGTIERNSVMGKVKSAKVAESSDVEQTDSAQEGDEQPEVPRVVAKGKKK